MQIHVQEIHRNSWEICRNPWENSLKKKKNVPGCLHAANPTTPLFPRLALPPCPSSAPLTPPRPPPHCPASPCRALCPCRLAGLARLAGRLAGRAGWPSWLAESAVRAGRAGWPGWLAGRAGCPRWLAGLAGRADWPGWLARLAGRVGWPGWLPGCLAAWLPSELACLGG